LHAVPTLCPRCAHTGPASPCVCLRARQVFLDLSDALGMPVAPAEGDSLVYPRRLVFVRVTACNVVSHGPLRTFLGAVTAGDTVLRVGQGSAAVHNLTACVPYWQSWVRMCSRATPPHAWVLFCGVPPPPHTHTHT
jgi:hypothetical protein